MTQPQTVSWAMVIASTLCVGWIAVAGDVFISPRLETQAGYEKNRMEEPGDGQGAFFWKASPGLDVTTFGAKTETSLFFDYRQTQYSKSDFETKEEASALAQWRHFGGQREVGASLGGGLYQDQALPNDDERFWQANPYLVHTLVSLPVELTLRGSLRQTFYDVSVYTSVTDRSDSLMAIRPGLRFHPSHAMTVWAEFDVEHNVSDASEAEYSGFGGTMGCAFRPATCLELGAWAGMNIRSYGEEIGNQDRRDTPSRMGAWMTYRLRPWMELCSSASLESFESTIDGTEYSWWYVESGVRFVFEHAFQRR